MDNVKRAKVIMLPTDKYSLINKCTLTLYNSTIFNHPKDSKYQHLYITSDDEIKESDWYYHALYNEIYQCNNKEKYRTIIYVNNSLEKKRCRKIIATTDTLLMLNGKYYNIDKTHTNLYLPKPSQQFVEKYIESYNKGEVITDVSVEYDEHRSKQGNFEGEFLKVNPKDNTITIKKLKESWNREEVETLITNAFKAGYKRSASGYPNTDNHMKPNVDKWIQENL